MTVALRRSRNGKELTGSTTLGPSATNALHVRVRRFARLAPDLAVLVGTVLFVRFRYQVLVGDGSLVGNDPGNWLSIGNALTGDRLAQWPNSPGYPPVVPTLVHLAVEVWGASVGLARLAAVASALPALGVYLVLRAMGHRWTAVPAMFFLLTASSVGEAATWGGYPQLVSLGLMPMVMWRANVALGSRRRSDCVLAGLLLATVFATSHFIALSTTAGVGLLGLWHLTHRESRRAILRSWSSFALAAVPLLPLVPFYLSFGAGISGTVSDRNGLLTNPVAAERFRELQFISRESPTLWKLVFATLLVAVALGVRRPTRALPTWQLVTAGFLATEWTTVFLGDSRVVYLHPTFAVMATALVLRSAMEWAVPIVHNAATWGPSLLVGVVAMAGTVTVGVQADNGAEFFRGQRSFYSYVDPLMLDGIRWLRTSTPTAAVVATPAIEKGGWGVWVEGLGKRRTLYDTDLRWLNFVDQQERARKANAIFRALPSTEALTLAHAAGVDYLAIPVRSDDGVWDAAAQFIAARPELVVFQNPRLVIINTARPPTS